MPRKSYRARRAIALRKEGKSARQTAEILGCSIRTVWRDTAGADLSAQPPDPAPAGPHDAAQPRSRRKDGRFTKEQGRAGRVTRIGWNDSLDSAGLEREMASRSMVPVDNPLRFGR